MEIAYFGDLLPLAAYVGGENKSPEDTTQQKKTVLPSFGQVNLRSVAISVSSMWQKHVKILVYFDIYTSLHFLTSERACRKVKFIM